MRLRVRENALCAFLAASGTATMAWLGLYSFTWSDYETEAKPAFEIIRGRLQQKMSPKRAHAELQVRG